MVVFEKNATFFDENDCCNLVDELENLIKHETAAYFDKLQLNIDTYAYFLANYIFLYGEKSAEKFLFSSVNYLQFIDTLTEKIKLRLEAFFGRPVVKQDIPDLLPETADLDDEIKDMAKTHLVSSLCEKLSHKTFRNACKALLPFPLDLLVSEVKPEEILFEGISGDDIKEDRLLKIQALLEGMFKSLRLKTQEILCRQVVDDVYSLWDETCENPTPEFLGEEIKEDAV